MNSSDLATQVNADLVRQKWAYLFLALGLIIVLVTFYYGLADGNGYASYLSHTKAERDAALAGASLLTLQAELESTEPWTKPLAFAGMGFLFVGIGLTLWHIIYRIQLRAQALALVVPMAVRRARKM